MCACARPAPTAGGGYGLGIVEALSDSWGVRGETTRVWFELTN